MAVQDAQERCRRQPALPEFWCSCLGTMQRLAVRELMLTERQQTHLIQTRRAYEVHERSRTLN